MDSVNFWGIFGALAAGLGVVSGAVGAGMVGPKWSGLLSNVWFDVAIACWVVGLLALVRMAWLRTAHLHAEGHRCPDPEAHIRPGPMEDVVRRDGNTVSALPLEVPFASPRALAAAGAMIPTPEPRVMCALSSAQLMRLYSQGATDVQGNNLVAQYKTQWREVSATVEQVIPQNEHVFSVSGKDSDQASVTFFFKPKTWASKLHGLMPGDPVRVAGQVDTVRPFQVVFTSCELVGALQGGGMPASDSEVPARKSSAWSSGGGPQMASIASAPLVMTGRICWR